nr:MAG TPA: hypothetical protein [Caudoviricetes sp.]
MLPCGVLKTQCKRSHIAERQPSSMLHTLV